MILSPLLDTVILAVRVTFPGSDTSTEPTTPQDLCYLGPNYLQPPFVSVPPMFDKVSISRTVAQLTLDLLELLEILPLTDGAANLQFPLPPIETLSFIPDLIEEFCASLALDDSRLLSLTPTYDAAFDNAGSGKQCPLVMEYAKLVALSEAATRVHTHGGLPPAFLALGSFSYGRTVRVRDMFSYLTKRQLAVIDLTADEKWLQGGREKVARWQRRIKRMVIRGNWELLHYWLLGGPQPAPDERMVPLLDLIVSS